MNFVKTEDEYQKFPTLKNDDAKKIRDWLWKQPHLPQISEVEILFFLQSCYNSVEQSKKTIDNFYTVRTHTPEFFGNRDVASKEMQDISKVILYAPLPQLTPEGYHVMYCKLMNCDPTKYIFVDAIKLYSFIIDLWLWQEGTAEGHVLVFDLDGIVLGHVGRLGIIPMKKFLYFLQEALPVRLKGLHFINTVPFMDKILAIMKPFMKKDLIDVMHLHTRMETIYPFVPQCIFPKEFGGDAYNWSELHRQQNDKLESHRAFFLEEEKTKIVDETKRPGKPKTVDELYGIDGNFKKLNID